ncbi:MAG: decaprenyl-phosphate phosphoribosyltransferase [Melioribacteraceae bacterium]|nr:decaprenyl-phosphate phosphoribosyltransferase [Melioribacteraceae bacterium]
MKEIIKLLRVSHWTKNVFVFVPLVFSKNLMNKDFVVEVLFAFVFFSIASSLVYVFNDLIDAGKDKLHQIKKFRPIASGKISRSKAVIIIFILIILTAVSFFVLNLQFNLVLLGYILLNISYSLLLKKIVIIDLLSVSIGFMLRVISGALVINVPLSSWLILTTLFLSLFLAVAKRRAEFIIYENENNTRIVLKDYNLKLLDLFLAVSAGGIIISYSLYSVAERTVNYFHTENLVFTTIFVIYGIFRYLYLIHKEKNGENSLEILLKDIPSIINILIYGIVIYYLIYHEKSL